MKTSIPTKLNAASEWLRSNDAYGFCTSVVADEFNITLILRFHTAESMHEFLLNRLDQKSPATSELEKNFHSVKFSYRKHIFVANCYVTPFDSPTLGEENKQTTNIQS